MPYALVQKSLDQRIDPKSLEEASVHVPSVARGDCPRLGRDLFGVVVTDLPHDEAIAFQTALEHFGFLTEIVPQAELPRLPDAKFRRGIRFEANAFTAVDGLGREDHYPWEEVQFAAGGFLQTVSVKTESRMEWNHHRRRMTNPRTGGGIQMSKHEVEVSETEFRLELFLSCEPFRLQFRAGPETLFRLDDAMLRFRQQDRFAALLQRVGEIVPADSQSQGLVAVQRNERFLYPSVPAFEEEITWHLFQRLRQAEHPPS